MSNCRQDDACWLFYGYFVRIKTSPSLVALVLKAWSKLRHGQQGQVAELLNTKAMW